ncbi:TPA: hypothetical protein OXC52_000004 [Enterobacter asburiae]|nr:hypothetical protein [Enterobacter cloacae complex sp. S3]HCW3077459.1 hypothetical protein [Enterobacter asburiae]HCW3087008.1 hypothetical protein [Enterobacter asburiae]HCW3142606.1 hypothetical protein [Enterobacter asburiae]HCW3426858.1 hypothetical protein [Enterobacter asburiae]
MKSFSVTLPFPLTASTETPYQLSIAVSAELLTGEIGVHTEEFLKD